MTFQNLSLWDCSFDQPAKSLVSSDFVEASSSSVHIPEPAGSPACPLQRGSASFLVFKRELYRCTMYSIQGY